MKTTKMKWVWPGLIVLSLVLAACGDLETNSTAVSATIRPSTVVAGAQTNNSKDSGIPTDPTRSATQVAGATATALPPTPTSAATATPAAQPTKAPSATTAASGGGTAATTAASGGGAAAAGNAAAGLKVFTSNGCGACHPGNGKTAGVGPKLLGTTRDDAYIRNNIRNGLNAMPAFTTDQVSDAQIEDIIAYIRSLK